MSIINYMIPLIQYISYHLHVCVNVYVHVHVCTCTCTRVYMYMYMRIHVHCSHLCTSRMTWSPPILIFSTLSKAQWWSLCNPSSEYNTMDPSCIRNRHGPEKPISAENILCSKITLYISNDNNNNNNNNNNNKCTGVRVSLAYWALLSWTDSTCNTQTANRSRAD